MNPKHVGNKFEQFIELQLRDYLVTGIAEIKKENDSRNYRKKLGADLSGGTRIFKNNALKNYTYIAIELKTTGAHFLNIKQNIKENQLNHLKRTVIAGGIAFYLVEFRKFNKIVRLDITKEEVKNETKELNCLLGYVNQNMTSIMYEDIKNKFINKKIFEANILPVDFLEVGNTIYQDFYKLNLLRI
jgi:penicillin-binding protein-related factor A (putative recombinase)